MNLNNHYCYFKSALPSRLCDDIIKHGLSHKETLGKTGDFDNKKLSKNDVNDFDVRSFISFLSCNKIPFT